MGTKQGMLAVGDILKDFKSDKDKRSLPLEFSRDKYISREFQKYGYDLAEELGDLKNKSLYIKLAKETPRALLEQAKNFVKDAYEVKSKPRLFMWRLKQLKEEQALKKSTKLQIRNPKQISNRKL
jgi:hypothetical protein